jgi:hypothetical protein
MSIAENLEFTNAAVTEAIKLVTNKDGPYYNWWIHIEAIHGDVRICGPEGKQFCVCDYDGFWTLVRPDMV